MNICQLCDPRVFINIQSRVLDYRLEGAEDKNPAASIGST